MIYAKSDLHPTELKKQLIKDSEIVESVWVEVRDKRNRRVTIGGIYRPPERCTVEGVPKSREQNKFIENEVIEEIEKASKRGGSLVVVGDFNYRGIDWSSGQYT